MLTMTSSPSRIMLSSLARSSSSMGISSSRSFSSWSERFHEVTAKLHHEQNFQESAQLLRELCKADLVRATDLRDDPEKFFDAHRIVARNALDHGPGFGVRFTVHYNLFGGTILAVGNEEQVAALDDYQREGKLGCFALTEKLAGVQSGLVVQTTADFDPSTQEFIINTPHKDARKNWISQGFTADKTVVVADLRVNGESKGPQAFVMDFRRNGELVDGIEIDDMGRKTTGNDLDNAWIIFNKVRIPKSALLSKYVDMVDNEFVIKDPNVRPFDMIGQRLYSGRFVVSSGGLAYRRALFDKTKAYSDNKKTFAFKGEPVLSNIPQLQALYTENDENMAQLEAFAKQIEGPLIESLKTETVPSDKLVDAIATFKVQASDRSIDYCFRLKQEVGSYALMDDSGFKHLDYLQMCKFAEGDSRILMQKMARDRMKKFMKEGPSGDPEELAVCKELAQGMAQSMGAGADQLGAWNQNWVTVYKLADAIMARIMREGL